MATRALSGSGAHEEPAGWFAPLRRWLDDTDPRSNGSIDLGALDAIVSALALRTESGHALRFVDASTEAGCEYERLVYDAGFVRTRVRGEGMLHDWFNALAWFAFPRTKARLNALHAAALNVSSAAPQQPPRQDPASRRKASYRAGARGTLRDRATLFDESGAVLVCADPTVRADFIARNWEALFVERRARFAAGAHVVVFGHSLFEKLLRPYKSICAQTIVLESGAGRSLGSLAPAATLDEHIASYWREEALPPLHPLPLLGVPGWWPPNDDAAFYDDPRVFRTERFRRRVTGSAAADRR